MYNKNVMTMYKVTFKNGITFEADEPAALKYKVLGAEIENLQPAKAECKPIIKPKKVKK